MTVKRVCPYPVGEIRMSVSATDPATIWPNTSWEQINGKFLMSCDADHAAGTTGGSATHTHITGNCTLTSDQIPSHAHSVGAHAHGLNSHTHGLNSHTHTYSKSNTPTAGTSITIAQMAKHSHSQRLEWNSKTGRGMAVTWRDSGTNATVDVSPSTGSSGSDSAHSHTVNFTSTNTGAASGNTANSAAFNSGSAGGGKAHSHGDTGSASNLPPYLAVYMWKRVA